MSCTLRALNGVQPTPRTGLLEMVDTNSVRGGMPCAKSGREQVNHRMHLVDLHLSNPSFRPSSFAHHKLAENDRQFRVCCQTWGAAWGGNPNWGTLDKSLSFFVLLFLLYLIPFCHALLSVAHLELMWSVCCINKSVRLISAPWGVADHCQE